jgi:YD repeat-containing protein
VPNHLSRPEDFGASRLQVATHSKRRSGTVFDGTGLVTQQKSGLNKTTQLFYDSAGRLSYTLDPLNRRIDNTFDDAGRQ